MAIRENGSKGRKRLVSPGSIRQLHLYLGLFFAPSLIFFASTGLFQLFLLHEIDDEGTYRPPILLEKLGSVHEDQRFVAKPRDEEEEAIKAMAAPPADSGFEPRALVLKFFFVSAALGLILSTCLGIWMGLTQGRRRRLVLTLLGLGTLVPILILAV